MTNAPDFGRFPLRDRRHDRVPFRQVFLQFERTRDGVKLGRLLPTAVWRLFLGRYEKLMLNGEESHVGWAWDKIGTNDNHYPERFTPITFTTDYVEDLA